MNYETTSRVSAAELQLTAGQSAFFTDFRNSEACAITVHAEPGATVYVSLSTSLPSRIAAGTARLTAAAIGELGTAPDGAPAGVVTGTDGIELLAPVTGIRFVCVGGSAAVELVQ